RRRTSGRVFSRSAPITAARAGVGPSKRADSKDEDQRQAEQYVADDRAPIAEAIVIAPKVTTPRAGLREHDAVLQRQRHIAREQHAEQLEEAVHPRTMRAAGVPRLRRVSRLSSRVGSTLADRCGFYALTHRPIRPESLEWER